VSVRGGREQPGWSRKGLALPRLNVRSVVKVLGGWKNASSRIPKVGQEGSVRSTVPWLRNCSIHLAQKLGFPRCRLGTVLNPGD
jgi:hypothetical protein